MIKKILIILILVASLFSKKAFAFDFETFYFESSNNIKVINEKWSLSGEWNFLRDKF